ncbi:1679_t:CDS:2, partial [Racocetra persica]
KERLNDGTEAAVGILHADNDYVSTPSTPTSLSSNADHLYVPGRRIKSAPPITSKSVPHERDNHARPVLSLQMPPSIVHRSNFSPPKENGINQDIIVELEGSQSRTALPLPDKVRIWIAYVCSIGSLLIVIAVILYDLIELAFGRNVF